MLDRIKQLQNDLRKSSTEKIVVEFLEKEGRYADLFDLGVLPSMQFSDMYVDAKSYHVYLNFLNEDPETFQAIIPPRLTLHRIAGYLGECYALEKLTIECYLHVVGEYRV